MGRFNPLAIIGSGCALPGALSPSALWDAVLSGESFISPPPDHRFGIDPERQASLGFVGGFVQGFDHDAEGPDAAVQWLLHAGRQAAKTAVDLSVDAARTAVILAQLGYPSRGLCDVAADVWEGRAVSAKAAGNRFDSAGPAFHLAHALDASGPCFALDAACASSLYALKLAADRLHAHEIDLAYVGGLNGVDHLMLQQGFHALGAASPTGRSRPFIEGADGLVASEGAAVVAVCRLEDVPEGMPVLGVIRGIGLSNDGARKGLLVPDATGQLEAMQRAWAVSGMDPAKELHLLEAHATGTNVGDAVEVASTSRLLEGRDTPVAVGTLKAQTGHLITASGLAGLIKLTEALQHKTLPPMRLEGSPLAALSDAPLEPVENATPWDTDEQRAAALSTFGFGGNNAHLIVTEDDGQRSRSAFAPVAAPEIEVIGLGLRAGKDQGIGPVLRRLVYGLSSDSSSAAIALDARKLRVPPRDLQSATAQQAAVLGVVEEAIDGLHLPDGERVGCFVGFSCATESARWMWRERLAERLGMPAIGGAADRLRDAVAAPLSAADVTGAMPNVSANRLNGAHDWRAPSFAVMSEASSGLLALETAVRALRAGEMDVAIVAAADFADNPVHRAAVEAMGIGAKIGDAACAIVLQRARTTRNPVLATISDVQVQTGKRVLPAARNGFSSAYGIAHGAAGLSETVASLAAGRAGLSLAGSAASPLSGSGPTTLNVTGGKVRVSMDPIPTRLRTNPVDVTSPRASESLKDGKVALVFTGAAAAYRGMGREIFSAFPELLPELSENFASAAHFAPLLGRPGLTPFEELCATTLLSQAQYRLWTQILGLRPDAAMGLSSGESNALMAFGFWTDPDALMDDIAASDMYRDKLGGKFDTATEHFGEAVSGWESWRVLAPIEKTESALADNDHASVTIIYAEDDVMVSGTPEACARFRERMKGAAVIRVKHDLIVHTPVLLPYGNDWWQLHCRKVSQVPGVTLYGHGKHGAYVPDDESVADALTQQALQPLDFPGLVQAAYADGVRTFIEIGPRDTLARSITKTLSGLPHLSVATDSFDRDGVQQIALAARTLSAAGIEIDMTFLEDRLAGLSSLKDALARPAHPVLVSPHPSVPRNALPMNTDCPLAEPPARPQVDWPDGFWRRGEVMEAAKPFRTSRPPRVKLKALPPTPLEANPPTGPSFDRDALERGAFAKLSDVFDPGFAGQDAFYRQVRMPRPPLLLCDRVTGLDAEINQIGKGTIWTESDVTEDHWAVCDGQMRLGPFVESGQADLLLISWMGVDLENRSDRIYRLLGCELTFHGGLPEVGETLSFQIEITGHTELNGVRMFFIQYDAFADDRPILSVRHGQAGFFTDAELAASKGVIWDPQAEGPPSDDPRLAPVSPTGKRQFSRADIDAFRSGDTYACFGAGFELAAPQSRPPRLPGGDLALFDDIDEFDPGGGPWGRGYIRARQHVPTDAWFYDGHFHSDPCMPGTLMVEAATQVMSFAMAALGMTLSADSHVFEPVASEPAKFICRGQVVPDSDHDVTYEIFVDEIVMDGTPTLYAALLASSDGKKVFYCPRFGLALKPRWPKAIQMATPSRQVGSSGDVRGDEAALAEMASGAPSRALGSLYAHFDQGGRLPRLPSPPFHFVTRIVSVDGPPGEKTSGLTAVAEYDVPPHAWYFADGGTGKMPLAVLTEIALQPCGWLAGFCGLALEGDSYFRNLDGKAEVLDEVGPETGTLSVATKLTSISRAGPLTIVFYRVTVTGRNGAKVMSLDTSFGFFTAAALASQAGLKRNETALAALELAPEPVDLPDTKLELPRGRMGMVDRVDYWAPAGGEAGLGQIRGRQSVEPRAWYFKAHFFSDPVQPGSLGLDALAQLAGRAIALKGLDKRFEAPRLEMPAAGKALSWTYRGQVVPAAGEVTTLIDILNVDEQADRTLVTARGHLFVDGVRIYEMLEFTLAIRETEATPGVRVHRVSPETPWVDSHRPTRTVPALPLMAMAGEALKATIHRHGAPVTLLDFAPKNWATVPEGGLTIHAKAAENGHVGLTGIVRGETVDDVRTLADGRWEAATEDGAAAFSIPAPGAGARDISDLYASCDLFHGPAMQPVVRGRRDGSAFELVLDLSRTVRPGDPFDPVILDGLVHGVPHQSAEDWFELDGDWIIYPRLIRKLTIHAPPPKSGELIVRGVPMPGASPPDTLPLRIEAFSTEGPFATLELVEKAFPKGRFARLTPTERFAFIAGKHVTNMTPLTDHSDGESFLKPQDVAACDWLPGSVATAYGAGKSSGTALVKAVLIREHFARSWSSHPSQIRHDGVWAWTDNHPRTRYAIRFDRDRRAWAVRHG